MLCTALVSWKLPAVSFSLQLSCYSYIWERILHGHCSVFCWPLAAKVSCGVDGGKGMSLKGHLFWDMSSTDEEDKGRTNGRTVVAQVWQLLRMGNMVLLGIHKLTCFSLRNSTCGGGNRVGKHHLIWMPWARCPLKRDFWNLNPGSCSRKHLPVLYCKDKWQHDNMRQIQIFVK